MSDSEKYYGDLSTEIPDMKIMEIDPPDSNRDRFQDFINNSKFIMALFYGKPYSPDIIKREFKSKLTMDPSNGNMEFLRTLIDRNDHAKSLVIAPTGSGKTFSINAIFSQMREEKNVNQLLCLVCPNKVQNIQNEHSDSYAFDALIEGVSLDDMGDGTKQISAVYDKILEIRKYKKEHPEVHLHLVIDECQNLISSNKFREQAIDAIMRLVKDDIADSYVFITATYDSMAGLIPFDKIVLFEDKSYRPVFDKIEIKYSQNDNFNDLLMDTIYHEPKAYVRLNDKKLISSVEATLNENGYKVMGVTSDDKGYHTNPDGEIVYDNMVFDSIINHDDLCNHGPNGLDVVLATSLLDAGTNFNSYSPDSTPMFAIQSPIFCQLDELEQSFNRFRPAKDENGNAIHLNKTIVLQKVPPTTISKAIIYTLDDLKNKHEVKILHSGVVTYFPDENIGADKKGIFSIDGDALEFIEPGKYFIELFSGKDLICTQNLYINYDTNTQDPTADNIESLLAKVMDSKDALFSGKTKSPFDFMDSVMTTLESFTSEYTFNYKTGDKVATAQAVAYPIPYFYTLTHITKELFQEGRKQLALFHNYQASATIANAIPKSTIPANVENVSIPVNAVKDTKLPANITLSDFDNSIFIAAIPNQIIEFNDTSGKSLIKIKTTDAQINVLTYAPNYHTSVEVSITNKHIDITPVDGEGDEFASSHNFDRESTEMLVINDALNDLHIVIENEVGSNIGGISEREYLESLLEVLRKQNPDVGDALFLNFKNKLLIDYPKLFNSAYSKYMSQFYYYPEKLKAELEKRLNVPVSIIYYTPQEFALNETDEKRESILEKINYFYESSTYKDLLCNIMHYGAKIPVDMPEMERQMIASILQSNVYKKEYKALQKLSTILTFDYIIKVINCYESNKQVNKHITRLESMLINQSIMRSDSSMPFSSKKMHVQYSSQKTLISILTKKHETEGVKKFTVNDKFIESVMSEYNTEIKKTLKTAKPLSKVQFKNLLGYTYQIENRDSKSRKPEVTEPILSVEDVPFI